MTNQQRLSASVLIPAYNATATIRDTLRSLQDQGYPGSHEVIVVDSSCDGTDQIVATEFPWVRLIHRPTRTDPGTARNLGIAQARGEVIACLDADCIAPADWLERIVAAQRSGHTVVGGAVGNGNPANAVAWAGYMGEFREFLPVGNPRVVTHIPTCNISYHHSIFDRFGGFPTDFYPQEDLLYHWRLALGGIPIWFDPHICVRHVHRSDCRSYLAHQHRIGRVTARVLRLTGAEGAFLARSPALALAAAPVLPFLKWARTLAAFWTRSPEVLRHNSLALAILLMGLYTWVAGFVAGAFGPPLCWSEEQLQRWQMP